MPRLMIGLIALAFALAGLGVPPPAGWSRQAPPPLERYRNLEFPPTEENFDKGWKDRVALEFEIVGDADLASLRAALEDPNPFVRSMAARALGIRMDRASAEALAELAGSDSEYFVRIRAVESLGYLKMKPGAISSAGRDESPAVRWTARMAAEQLGLDADFAAPVRKAFAAGLDRDKMASAKVGQPAPDFTAQTLDGKPFKLSTVLGKKPIALYFSAYDG